MKIFTDLLKLLLLSSLLLLFLTVKLTKKFLNWFLLFLERVMNFGENGLDAEIGKLKSSIRDIFLKIYQKISS